MRFLHFIKNLGYCLLHCWFGLLLILIGILISKADGFAGFLIFPICLVFACVNFIINFVDNWEPYVEPQKQKMSVEFNKNIVRGAIVNFGPYRWKVLSKSVEEALLITEEVIDCKQFDEKGSPFWYESSLRNWLNGDFLEQFNSADLEKIIPTTIRGFVTRDTSVDKAFLLSFDDVKLYFDTDDDLICYPNEKAKLNKIRRTPDNSCLWWLRTESNDNCGCIVYVMSNIIAKYGDYPDSHGNGVRPAMWVKF